MKELKHYLQKARNGRWALPQFNFSDFTQLKAIIEVAQKMKSPIILGTSEGESNFFGLEEAVVLRDFFRKKTKVPIFLNFDHGTSFELLEKAIRAGYDMVHFDGSELSLEKNILLTRKIIKLARRKRILVEGEVGRIGKKSSIVHQEKVIINEEDLTKPSEALIFSRETRVDLLAISIGNYHGIEEGSLPYLRLNILKKIKQLLGEKSFLVLHGGSGIREEDIKEAIKWGINKININTELRLAFTGTLREVLKEDSQEIRPYKFFPLAQDSVKKIVASKINLFKSYNKI